MRILNDPAFAYTWCAAIVAGLAALLIVGDARVFIIIWAAGGLAAVAIAKQDVATTLKRPRR